MSTYTVPRGTKDILPDESHLWQHIEKVSREIFSTYCYSEIRTPAFEATGLFSNSIGDETEIVEKEMYSFEDKGGRSLTLRPEGTAPIVRSCIQHNLLKQTLPAKLFYMGPYFRYERPQAGRYRQFHQIGIENIGRRDPYIDAEVIGVAYHIFKSLGLKNVSVLINSIGCEISRPVIEERIRQFLSTNLKKLPEKLQEKFTSNPLRLLDAKDDTVQQYLIGMPDIKDVLSQESKDHFYSVLDHLDGMKIPYTVKNTLVRGLDYYTETVFEIVSDDLGTKNTLCGGGRYNNLVKSLGGGDFPAMGFAFGVERAVQLCKELIKSKGTTAQVYFISIGELQRSKSFFLANKLRQLGISADISYEDNLKAELKKASQKNYPYVVIIGEEELEQNIVLLKDMNKRSQEELKLPKFVSHMKELFSQGALDQDD